MKLVLGTAQFGLDYGISNSDGQTPLSEVKKILRLCGEYGIFFIDTAPSYGDSEELIGNYLADGFKVITKTYCQSKNGDEIRPRSSLNESLEKLNNCSIYGLLFHNAEDLFSRNGEVLFRDAKQLKEEGLVEKIGVSIYHPQQAELVLKHFDLDILQGPLNIFDQRLYQAGILNKLKRKNIEFHSRSIFLQGLLLMNPDKLDPYFFDIIPLLKKWQRDLKVSGITPLCAALNFVKNIPEVKKIIVGVNNSSQLSEIMKQYQLKCDLNFNDYAISNEKFIDPTRWLAKI